MGWTVLRTVAERDFSDFEIFDLVLMIRLKIDDSEAEPLVKAHS